MARARRRVGGARVAARAAGARTLEGMDEGSAPGRAALRYTE